MCIRDSAAATAAAAGGATRARQPPCGSHPLGGLDLHLRLCQHGAHLTIQMRARRGRGKRRCCGGAQGKPHAAATADDDAAVAAVASASDLATWRGGGAAQPWAGGFRAAATARDLASRGAQLQL
eukprot:scaffold70380_cov51-Phaeocystis_antarctica.AAC.1